MGGEIEIEDSASMCHPACDRGAVAVHVVLAPSQITNKMPDPHQ